MERMLERIATAIMKDRLQMTGISFEIDPGRDELADARAALEAMREPTQEMVMAAAQKLLDPSVKTSAKAAQVAWQAMIDAALAT
jgi:hypothetical protein